MPGNRLATNMLSKFFWLLGLWIGFSAAHAQQNLQNWQNSTRAGALNSQIESSELLNYLISDVCLNSAGEVVAGDPFTCVNRRNLQIGENIPYIVTDLNTASNNTNYQAMVSQPFVGTDGHLKIVNFKSLKGPHKANYLFQFNVQRDGFDLIDVSNSGYASFIRTSDPGCYDQLWSPSSNVSSIATRAGGWLLFPLNIPTVSGNVLNTTFNTPLSPSRPASCQGGNSSGVTAWDPPQLYTFETRKVMKALKSYHFAASNLAQSNNALELYYFTKEYGFTRWEAWIPQSRCFAERGSENPACHPDWSLNALRGRCSVMNVSATGQPGIDLWGGQTWVRVDCRDQTNYIALTTPQIFMDRVVAQNNGVVDLDTSGLQSLPTAVRKVIPGGTILRAGESISAGSIRLAMQADGNLVVYDSSNKALWASSSLQQFNVPPFLGPTYGLACTQCYASFQTDGNLVLYNPAYTGNIYKAYWSSNTWGTRRVYELSTSAPHLKISAAPVDASAAIDSYYRQYLGRAADAGGLNYYLQQYYGGRSLASIEAELRNCPEAQIRSFYLTYFLREPDPGGFQYWLNEYTSGRMTLEGIRNNFRHSTDCRVMCL